MSIAEGRRSDCSKSSLFSRKAALDAWKSMCRNASSTFLEFLPGSSQYMLAGRFCGLPASSDSSEGTSTNWTITEYNICCSLIISFPAHSHWQWVVSAVPVSSREDHFLGDVDISTLHEIVLLAPGVMSRERHQQSISD